MKTPSTAPADVARLFQALADETRVRLIEMLSAGECCVCELQESLDAAQSRLSFHLRVLREAGLVNDRREGRWVYYSLRADTLGEMMSYLEERQAAVPTSSGCGCGQDGGHDGSGTCCG
ncbi:MAG: metalloregulator ArsR/SmtB family transcription factor [Gemmatimonadota bacterium]